MFPWQFTVGGSALAVPTVTGVSTAGGAVGDIAGNYTATVTGTGFVIGATSFTFGGTSATGVSVSSSTTATMTVPAHATGSVSVVATTAGGSSIVNGTFEYYSPAQESLTAWVRGSYAGSPWTPTASAGSSASNGNFTTYGVAPTVGATQNSIAPASFNGSSQALRNLSLGYGTAITTSAYSITLLVKPTATAATIHAGATYQDPAFVTDDTQGYPNINYTTSGIALGHYDGTWKEVVKACSAGAYHIVHAWYDGTNINIEVDGVAATPVAASALAAGSGLVQFGVNYSFTAFAGGLIEEVIIAPSNLGSTKRAKLKSYVNTRYNLSL